MFAKFALLSALVMSLTAAVSQAGDRKDAKLALMDQRFVHAAGHGGMMEIDAAQLALERGSSQAVKDYARQMIRDHEQANQELMTLAQSKGVKLPATLEAMHKRLNDQERLALRHMVVKHRDERMLLESMSGAMFDQAYIGGQVKDHHQMVGLFEVHSRHSMDPDIKAWATKTLPHLQMHLRRAQEIAGVPMSASTAPAHHR